LEMAWYPEKRVLKIGKHLKKESVSGSTEWNAFKGIKKPNFYRR
jgi:hypothetical protein